MKIIVCEICNPSPYMPHVEHPELCSIIYCKKCNSKTYHYPTYGFKRRIKRRNANKRTQIKKL